MSSALEIRPAVPDDVDRLVELAAQRRAEYAGYQPQLWRPAPDAKLHQRPFFSSLVADNSVLSLVATSAGDLVGFVIAALVPAPPVYEPGGMTCLIDDFTVKRAEDWVRVGVPLLAAVSDLARQRGAAQVVVVTAHLDEAKRNALRAGGLTIASEWWVSPPEADSAP